MAFPLPTLPLSDGSVSTVLQSCCRLVRPPDRERHRGFVARTPTQPSPHTHTSTHTLHPTQKATPSNTNPCTHVLDTPVHTAPCNVPHAYRVAVCVVLTAHHVVPVSSRWPLPAPARSYSPPPQLVAPAAFTPPGFGRGVCFGPPTLPHSLGDPFAQCSIKLQSTQGA